MPISTRVSRFLAAVAALIAGVVPHAVAQETKGAPIVQREVFAEHPTVNVVNTIMRVKRDGLDGVLIVGSGNASMSCFVPDGGTASCAALKLTSVDAAQLVGSHDGDATSLLDMDVGVDHRLGLVDPAQRRPDQLRLRLVGWAASRIASVSTRVSSAGSSAAI